MGTVSVCSARARARTFFSCTFTCAGLGEEKLAGVAASATPASFSSRFAALRATHAAVLAARRAARASLFAAIFGRTAWRGFASVCVARASLREVGGKRKNERR